MAGDIIIKSLPLTSIPKVILQNTVCDIIMNRRFEKLLKNEIFYVTDTCFLLRRLDCTLPCFTKLKTLQNVYER